MIEVQELDALDRAAADAFPGSLVRKDLALKFKGQYPVPTYVGEFLLGRYCASVDPGEIAEGLQIVQRQLKERTVRAGEHELFKSRARERGSVKLIDLVTARLDAVTDSYLATLPSLQLKDVRIADTLVRENERMLTGGFYAEIELEYHPALDVDSGGRPFAIAGLRPIQLSKRDVLESVARGRAALTTEQWRELLLRSVGFEPAHFSRREQDLLLLRMVPFVERNYNLVELGPRGTGKSHLFQQISPYSHLVSGGKASVARMFVDNRTGQRGLVAQYDVVCFDEVGGIDFDSKDGVNIMKGYMESGEFSRGRESIRATGGIVMVGNFDVDVAQQLRIGHLFGPFPKEMRDDTAFMDRIHAYLPGWDIPKLDPRLFTLHFGLVSDYLSEAWSRLRDETRLTSIQGRVVYGSALSGRDRNAVDRTVSGLLKLLYPDHRASIPDADIEWAVGLAMEMRLRVKEQQKRIGRHEFARTDFSFSLGGREHAIATPEQGLDRGAAADPPSTTEHVEVPAWPRSRPAPPADLPIHQQPDLSAGSVEALIAAGESVATEFKASLRWDIRQNADNPALMKEVSKSIAAFLNGKGGRVLIGVADDRSIPGIDQDIRSLERQRMQGGPDGFLQSLAGAINQHLGAQAAARIRTQIVKVQDRLVCVVHVGPSPQPVYLKEKDREDFFVRLETTTRALGVRETTEYVKSHWG